MGPGDEIKGDNVEIVASQHPCPGELDPYERVLGDAMGGDATHFAREDYVEMESLWSLKCLMMPIPSRGPPWQL